MYTHATTDQRNNVLLCNNRSKECWGVCSSDHSYTCASRRESKNPLSPSESPARSPWLMLSCSSLLLRTCKPFNNVSWPSPPPFVEHATAIFFFRRSTERRLPNVYNGSLAPAKMQRKQTLNSLQAGQFSVSWNNTTPHHIAPSHFSSRNGDEKALGFSWSRWWKCSISLWEDNKVCVAVTGVMIFSPHLLDKER